jgi:opacity protein-like surface antigen
MKWKITGAALAALTILAGCSATTVKNRMKSEPLKIDQFYTTALSGELKTKVEQVQAAGRSGGYIVVTLNTPPPRVDSFAAGETVCVAVHSSSGSGYTYGYRSGPLGTDTYGRTEYSQESGRTTVSGSGKGEIKGEDIFFAALSVGGQGGWRATCTAYKVDKSFPIVRRKADRMLTVNHLPAGSYKVLFKAEERHTKRTHKVEAAFNIK